MEFLVGERELVIPGTHIGSGKLAIEGGAVREGEEIYSTVLGLAYYNDSKKKVKVVPLEGKYIPKAGDSVVGMIVKVLPGKWLVDINSAYLATLDPRNALRDRVEDLSRIYNVGDLIFAKVEETNEIHDVTLFTRAMPYGKLRGGTIVEIHTTRVPRLIGKKGSMIYMLKNETRSKILVGQNGLIWVKGRKSMEELVEKAIHKINVEAHIPGLTDRTKEFLENEKKRLIVTGDLYEKM
ncbi:MAG: exosome complex RNA-binding protein Rrp4 [Candidatus Methanofastidiosia archaeon]